MFDLSMLPLPVHDMDTVQSLLKQCAHLTIKLVSGQSMTCATTTNLSETTTAHTLVNVLQFVA